ncbi:MAG TPA: hypothetical protein VJ180_07755, partial [Pyrinomonadaceae bacterium]|nr:hypothetical protein [Pyrinomonadaceae bacterium]
MLHVNKQVTPINLLTKVGRIWSCVVLLIVTSNGYGQTITNPNPPTVQTPSTVGQIVKWTGVAPSGRGIVGDSVITESAGNIGIGVASPNFKLVVGGAIRATGLGVSGNVTALGTVSGDIVNATT